MKNRSVVFTNPGKAELLDTDIAMPKSDEVLTETIYSVISGGTERACLTNQPNTPQKYPLQLGYCSIGTVKETGSAVKDIVPGQRVLVYHGTHSKYNLCPVSQVTPVDDEIDSLSAAPVIIASMGLGGVRKLELELGESAMVIGLGLLGLFAVSFARMSGANPVIAVDFSEKRRELALKLGADYAFSPADADFAEKIKSVTNGKGVNGCVEVTGNSAALQTALDCASYMGRIALLGCTRVSDTEIDYYRQVHKRGVRLIGAHNFIRPKLESYPHHWTHQDDCRAILSMIKTKRLDPRELVSRVVSPEECGKIYDELCNDKNFMLGTVFDWRNIKAEDGE